MSSALEELEEAEQVRGSFSAIICAQIPQNVFVLFLQKIVLLLQTAGEVCQHLAEIDVQQYEVIADKTKLYLNTVAELQSLLSKQIRLCPVPRNLKNAPSTTAFLKQYVGPVPPDEVHPELLQLAASSIASHSTGNRAAPR